MELGAKGESGSRRARRRVLRVRSKKARWIPNPQRSSANSPLLFFLLFLLRRAITPPPPPRGVRRERQAQLGPSARAKQQPNNGGRASCSRCEVACARHPHLSGAGLVARVTHNRKRHIVGCTWSHARAASRRPPPPMARSAGDRARHPRALAGRRTNIVARPRSSRRRVGGCNADSADRGAVCCCPPRAVSLSPQGGG